jgi:hypothetical protein
VSTTTVSVRDGWLTVADSDGPEFSIQISHIEWVQPFRREASVRGCVAMVGNDERYIYGPEHGELMELIHAGSGTITREVE